MFPGPVRRYREKPMGEAAEYAVIFFVLLGILYAFAGNTGILGGVLAEFGNARLMGYFGLTLLFPALWNHVKEAWQLLFVFGVIALLA